MLDLPPQCRQMRSEVQDLRIHMALETLCRWCQAEPSTSRHHAPAGQRERQGIDQHLPLLQPRSQIKFLQALFAPKKAFDLERKGTAQLGRKGKAWPAQSF